jgi:hypothetical protein
MIRMLTTVLVTAWAVGSPLGAQRIAHPASLVVDGAAPLPLAAQAARTHLLGHLELYSVALYVDGARLDHAQLLSPGVAKAVRIAIDYKDDLQRPVWNEWRNELVPRVNAAGAAHLRGAYASLREGDVVLIEYVPAKGTTVRVNKAVATSGASHELVLAYLDHFLGQRPVSDEMKQALLRGGGTGGGEW